MNMFRKVCAVRLSEPVGELHTVGDVLAFSACYGIVFGLAWLLVWPA